MIRARWSLTQTPGTQAQKSRSGRWFPAKMPDLAKHLSKPGSNPRDSRRARIRRPQRKQQRSAIRRGFAYDNCETNLDVAVPDSRHGRHGGTEGSEGDVALFEGPDGLSWQGRSDDHG